jgi:uncharacterized protein (TIGR03083 family)
MDSDTIWHHIDTQRSALCDVLETLTDEQWRHPSLCEGWTVRDVAAHLTLAQARLRQVVLPWLRSGLRPNAMIRDTALACPLSHEEIVATIRGFAGSRRRAPFVSEREPLLDVLVHSQDICVPLGVDHPLPPDAAVTAIGRLMQLNRTPLRMRPPLRGVRLSATDADWTWGDGKTVEGELRWLLLLVAGRDVARRHLTGAVAAL